jgi:predicted ester cyclase
MSATPIDERKARSRRLYEEVFGRGNLAAADEILAEACVSHGPGSPPNIGSEGIKRQALVFRSGMPDLRAILEDQIAEGDLVATRWTGRGTHTGVLALAFGPVPPSGTTIEFAEIRIDRHAGDQIIESWFIPDRLTLWQQLGLVPTPGVPSR